MPDLDADKEMQALERDQSGALVLDSKGRVTISRTADGRPIQVYPVDAREMFELGIARARPQTGRSVTRAS